jgi:hypothetical protein
MLLACGRGSGSDRLYLAVTDQNISIFDHPVGKDDRTCENHIGHCFSFSVDRKRRKPFDRFSQQIRSTSA